LRRNKPDLGYALLLKRSLNRSDQSHARRRAARGCSTIPNVPVLFWSFRVMVGAGLYFIALIAYSFWLRANVDWTPSAGI